MNEVTSSSKHVSIEVKNEVITESVTNLDRTVYEVVLRVPEEFEVDNKKYTKITNINVMLVKMGFAECTNMAIFDGETDTLPVELNMEDEEQQRVGKNGDDLDFTPRKTKRAANYAAQQTYNRLNVEIDNMIGKVETKLIHTKPGRCVMCRVTCASSPAEIWFQDVVESKEFYPDWQEKLKEK